MTSRGGQRGTTPDGLSKGLERDLVLAPVRDIGRRGKETAHRAGRVRGANVTPCTNMEISKGTFMESGGTWRRGDGHLLLKIDSLSSPESGVEPPDHQRRPVLSVIRSVSSTPAGRHFSGFTFETVTYGPAFFTHFTYKNRGKPYKCFFSTVNWLMIIYTSGGELHDVLCGMVIVFVLSVQ